MKLDLQTKWASVRKHINKYVIASVIFAVWMLFFDQNNIIKRISDMRTLHNMKAQKEYFINKIETDTRRTEELLSDDENLEKFAREQYLMKKPNEDVFVVIEK